MKKIILLGIGILISISAFAQDKDKDALLRSNPGEVKKLPPFIVDPSLIKESPKVEPSTDELMRDLNFSTNQAEANKYRVPTNIKSNQN